jgi:hypothetical protein
MKNQPATKVTLRREVLRRLTDDRLAQVHGGNVPRDENTCDFLSCCLATRFKV